MSSGDRREFRPEPSSGSLRFKISLSKREMEHEEPEGSPNDLPFKTSYSLYVVLSEIHRLCVKRDHKGIFAHPVTEDIAPDYFSIISKPMDLGTIYSRLESRSYYSTAGQYLSDLRLMCQNAMCYNPPDTIYYQKARKLLAFAEKQMTPHTLRKLSAELLKMCRPLTDEEIGEQINDHHRHHQSISYHNQHHIQDNHNNYCGQTSISTTRDFQSSTGGIFTPPKLQEEEVEEIVEDEDIEEGEAQNALTGEPSSSSSMSSLKRHTSSASVTSCSKLPRYACSPPVLVPEVDDSVGRVDSPLTQSTGGRNDSDIMTIDLETIDVDTVETSLTLSPASSTSTLRGTSRKNTRRSALKKSVPPPPPRPPTSLKPRRKNGCRPFTNQPSDRVYSEDAWTFSDSHTDRTPAGQVVMQVKRAAQEARAKFLARYGRPGQQTVVCLDVNEPGKIYARPCASVLKVENEEEEEEDEEEEEENEEKTKSETTAGWRKPVEFPLALRQLLTPRPSSTGQCVYHGLVEQMTSQQVATLHALSKLRYDPTEPIAIGIHGPLAIFEKDELAQLCDAYGGDVVTMESVLSVLTFVEPLGEWARRWAHRRLNNATDGYHGKMLLAFVDTESEFYERNWMKRAGLTIDASLVEELKADKTKAESVKEAESPQVPVDTPDAATPSSSSDFQPMEIDSNGSGHMSIAKLPSNTSTTSTTVKQMATVQPLQRLNTSSSASPDDKSVVPDSTEVSIAEVEEEGESFDILSAALNASVTPAVEEQMPQPQPSPQPQQQQQQQQYVLTAFRVMEGGTTSAIMESSTNSVTVPNPLAASVNDIAQISALTAAISPIQPVPGLPEARIAVPKPLPAAVAGETACPTSTLLVVDRKAIEEKTPVEGTLPIVLGLRPSSGDSPLEESPSKSSVAEGEEIASGENEGDFLDVSGELPCQGSSKLSLSQRSASTDSSQASVSSELAVDDNPNSRTLAEMEPVLPPTTQPNFGSADASLSNISVKIGGHDVEDSSVFVDPSENLVVQPRSLEPCVASTQSGVKAQTTALSNDATPETVHHSSSAHLDAQSGMEMEIFAAESRRSHLDNEISKECSSQISSPPLARETSTPPERISKDKSTAIVEGRKDLPGCTVEERDIQNANPPQSPETSGTDTSSNVNLNVLEASALPGSSLTMSASLEPFQQTAELEVCVESPSVGQNLDLNPNSPRASVTETGLLAANRSELVVNEEIPNTSTEEWTSGEKHPNGNGEPLKDIRSCAEIHSLSPAIETDFAVYTKDEFEIVPDVSALAVVLSAEEVEPSSSEHFAMETLQTPVSMDWCAVEAPSCSNETKCGKTAEATLKPSDESACSIDGGTADISVDVKSAPSSVLIEGLCEDSRHSNVPPHVQTDGGLEVGVEYSGVGFSTHGEVELPVHQRYEPPPNESDFSESKMDNHSSQMLPSSEAATSPVICDELTDLSTHEIVGNYAPDRSEQPEPREGITFDISSSEGSSCDVQRLVDYDCTESSENDATNQLPVSDAPIDNAAISYSPRPTPLRGLSGDYVAVDKSLDATRTRETSEMSAVQQPSPDVSMSDVNSPETPSEPRREQIQMEMDETLQSYPSRFEMNNATTLVEEEGQTESFTFATSSETFDACPVDADSTSNSNKSPSQGFTE